MRHEYKKCKFVSSKLCGARGNRSNLSKFDFSCQYKKWIRHHKHHNFMVVASNSRFINDIPVLVLEKDTKVMWWLLHFCKVIPMRYTCCSPSQIICIASKRSLSHFFLIAEENGDRARLAIPDAPRYRTRGMAMHLPPHHILITPPTPSPFFLPKLSCFPPPKRFSFRPVLTLVRDYLARIRYSIFFL